MSVKYPNYVNLTSLSEEQPNERTPLPPPRKKSLSPPQAPSKSTSSKSTHYTSSSSPSESPTPTHVTPPPKLCFIILIKQEPQKLLPLQISPNDPYSQTMMLALLFSEAGVLHVNWIRSGISGKRYQSMKVTGGGFLWRFAVAVYTGSQRFTTYLGLPKPNSVQFKTWQRFGEFHSQRFAHLNVIAVCQPLDNGLHNPNRVNSVFTELIQVDSTESVNRDES
ncbi:hypothetical protein Tco_0091066 [Tanacetum coccineum]